MLEANNLSIIEALCNASSIQGLSKVGPKGSQRPRAILKEVAEMPECAQFILPWAKHLRRHWIHQWLASEDTKESEGRLTKPTRTAISP